MVTTNLPLKKKDFSTLAILKTNSYAAYLHSTFNDPEH